MKAWTCERHIYLNDNYISGKTISICKDKETAVRKCEEHFINNIGNCNVWKIEKNGYVPFHKVEKGSYTSIYRLEGNEEDANGDKMKTIYRITKIKID